MVQERNGEKDPWGTSLSWKILQGRPSDRIWCVCLRHKPAIISNPTSLLAENRRPGTQYFRFHAGRGSSVSAVHDAGPSTERLSPYNAWPLLPAKLLFAPLPPAGSNELPPTGMLRDSPTFGWCGRPGDLSSVRAKSSSRSRRNGVGFLTAISLSATMCIPTRCWAQ